MDAWAIFFVLALAAALITTVFILVKISRDDEDTPPKPASPQQERPADAEEETLPPNVAVVYTQLRESAEKRCRGCDCEYASSVTVCEICGEPL